MDKTSGKEEYALRISDNVREIPLKSYPTYIDFSLVGLCRGGNATFEVHGKEHTLTAGEMIVFFPRQLVSLRRQSPDFSLSYLLLSYTLYTDVMGSLPRFEIHFFFFMKEHFYFSATAEQADNFSTYVDLIRQQRLTVEDPLSRARAIHLLDALYIDLYHHYLLHAGTTSRPAYRKEQLAYTFYDLVYKHYKEHRDIAFYAGKMNISTTYLTMITKETSNKSAKEYISDFITQEIKALLRDNRFNIQEIALKLNFPRQSDFNRFFKKQAGLSLSEYRRNSRK
ncbi:MAG: AraC family transcriptional regulator [Porphyromonadaceae bacterium]|nr:AraC family transcriptional regulator [Porphyromonadaceae bacterium]